MEEEQDQEQVALEELGETREVESQKNDQPDDIKGARFHTGGNETVAPITGGKLLDQSSISGAHPQLQNRRQLFASFSENAKVQVWRS